jgi:hypothetical protein
MMTDESKIVCTAKEVMNIINVSPSTANNKIKLLRDALDKPKPKIVTLKDFKEYYGL